jgi:cell division transport system ATP-binding protein
MNIFRRFNEVGVTVLVASHDLYLLERFPVRRVRLEAGRIVEAGDEEPVGLRLLDPGKLLASDESNLS